MSKPTIIEDLALLLRGFFTTPVISSLGRLGVLDDLKSLSSFTVDDVHVINNKRMLQVTFDYFTRLGLLEIIDNQGGYRATELGKEIFRRASSFYVPHSYYEYMYHYHSLIQDPHFELPKKVERLENVIGSGKTHQRYFIPVVAFVKRKLEFDLIADIGCGDGHFLLTFISRIKGKKAAGVDISKVSTEVSYKNIKDKYPDQELCVVCSDALDVDTWSAPVLEMAATGNILLSMWFLLHEISRNKLDNIVDFLNHVHRNFPHAPLIIGEVVRQDYDILAKNSAASIMPEYLFFHEMSGQGILSWQEYQQLLKRIPYELIFSELFDDITDEATKNPSAFVWCLKPR